MSKKMKLPNSPLNNSKPPPRPQWPSCKQPNTLSFQDMKNAENAKKNINQSLLGMSELRLEEDTRVGEEDSIEAVIRGLRSSERLFFEPEETPSILNEAKSSTSSSPTLKEKSVVCAMESHNPYLDFKKSMEEMVMAHGMLLSKDCDGDWDCLEELLCWYLEVNGKENHGYIVGAFVDLLHSFSSTTSTSCSPSHTCSSNVTSTTTCSSSLQVENCDCL